MSIPDLSVDGSAVAVEEAMVLERGDEGVEEGLAYVKTVPAIVRVGTKGFVGTDAMEPRVDDAGGVVEARLVVEGTATGATEEDVGMISAIEVEGRTVG